MTRILAIDPGSEQSAWCEFDGEIPTATDKLSNSELLERLRCPWRGYNFVAIEMIASYGMPVGREVFETCVWIGRFMEAWQARGGAVKLVYRRDVKLFLCESNRANDATIRAAIIDHFGPGKDKAIGKKATPGPLYGIKGDEWAALAVALTVAGRRRVFHVEPALELATDETRI